MIKVNNKTYEDVRFNIDECEELDKAVKVISKAINFLKKNNYESFISGSLKNPSFIHEQDLLKIGILLQQLKEIYGGKFY